MEPDSIFSVQPETQVESSIAFRDNDTDASQHTFTSVSGSQVAIPVADATATVLIFVSSTCPIANGYAPEINRLIDEYGKNGIQFHLVHTETDLRPKAAKKHLEDFDYKCEVLLDPTRMLVEKTGATITPEAAVLSPDGELLYRGRIDDRFPVIGIQKSTPSKTELRDALAAIVDGKPIAVARTKAIGCYIE